ncbi:MAG TPA: response regulator [Allosphingosinicella sp.]
MGAGGAVPAIVAVEDEMGEEARGVSEPFGAPSNAPDDARAPRLLLVEDDFLVGMELEDGLAEAGYEIAGVAASAEEALTLAERERPLLVVMDIRLTGERDGIDAAIEIRRRLGIASLFATARADSATRARAEEAAPLGWVVKPYRVSTLVEAVAKALDAIGGRGPGPTPTPRPA